MMRKKTNRTGGGIGKWPMGILLQAGLLPICVLLFCAIAYALEDPTPKLGLFSLGAFLLCAAVSASVMPRLTGGFLPALLSSLLFALLILLGGLIGSRGHLPAMACMNLLCYMLTSAFFAFLASRKRERRHRARGR